MATNDIRLAMTQTKYIPPGIRADISSRGLWQDLVQSMYVVCCQHHEAVDILKNARKGITAFLIDYGYYKKYSGGHEMVHDSTAGIKQASNKQCLLCGEWFVPKSNNQKYCSIACCEIERLKRRKERRSNPFYKRSTTSSIERSCKMCNVQFNTNVHNQVFHSTKCKDNWYYHSVKKRRKGNV
jgi:hypothetical protein